MTRRREKIKWRASLRTWSGRVVTVLDDGRLDRGPGWLDLRTDNQELAQAIYDRWLETGVPPQQADKQTFGQAALAFVEAQPPNRATRDRRTRLDRYALPVIGMVELRDFEPAHVTAVLKFMIKCGRPAGTLRKMRSDLSQILSDLMTDGVLSSNVALGVPIPKNATMDTRLRMNLTDEQYLQLMDSLGAGSRLGLMCKLVREVAGYRTSDLHAGDWKWIDLVAFEWVRVRRPKTDTAQGKSVAHRKVRHYERVRHTIPEHLRPEVRAYWEATGRRKKGAMFPVLRPGVGGTVKGKHGAYERKASAVGDFKGEGSSYAEEFRDAVWEAGIYSPRTDDGFDDFDPADPDRQKCAFQTDTPETKRLDFMSLRRDYVTAVAGSGVSTQEALALSGHTQLTTQMRHYMKERQVETPSAALPRRGAPEPSPAPSPADEKLATLQRMMEQMLTLQQGVGGGATPSEGVEKPNRALRLVRK